MCDAAPDALGSRSDHPLAGQIPVRFLSRPEFAGHDIGSQLRAN
jgi:hypothetical protein